MVGSLVFDFFVFPGLLFTLAAGILASWVVRKVSALIQWRVGPPLLQPAYDIAKLFGKENIIPKGGAEWSYIIAPLLGPAGLLLASIILVNSNYLGTSFIGDVIVVLYLLVLPALSVVVGGMSTGNSLSAMGSNRELRLMVSYELPLLLAVTAAIVKSGGLKLAIFTARPVAASVSGALGFIAALLCIQAELGFIPFDTPEAETELMGGPLIEYSGPLLGLYKISNLMALLVLPLFLVTVFLGGFSTGWGALWGAIKYLLVLVGIILIKNTNPRLRSDQALKFFWYGAAPLALIALILAVVGDLIGIGWV
ncbi:NADH-quinone oxidoreductase subunit H [Candidatus Bipolaricaulota bacterium]|nr:NADH-quinone oxidoreductase subunit H [Candidatus Bipolaricaulota bacterium]